MFWWIVVVLWVLRDLSVSWPLVSRLNYPEQMVMNILPQSIMFDACVKILSCFNLPFTNEPHAYRTRVIVKTTAEKVRYEVPTRFLIRIIWDVSVCPHLPSTWYVYMGSLPFVMSLNTNSQRITLYYSKPSTKHGSSFCRDNPVFAFLYLTLD